MSDTPHEHRTIKKDNYEVTFHPAFASRCVVTDDAQNEKELYKQKGTHKLPQGQRKPPTKHTLRLGGGKHRRNVTLQITDPENRIASITVAFYADDHVPGTGDGGDTVETLEVYNDPVLCPPTCDGDDNP